jgi:hypothetical protein
MDSLVALVDYKDVIAQVSGAICVLYGLVFFLAPKKGRHLYNSKDLVLKDPKSLEICDYLVQRSALCLITSPVTMWLHVDVGLSRDEAVGLAVLPWILLCLHSLLNETHQSFGSSPRADYISLFMFCCVACATLTHATFSSLAVKILSGFTMANGLLAFMSPAAIGTLYGTPEREDFILLMIRSYGLNLIIAAVFTAAFASGVPQLKTIGITWAAACVGLLVFLLNNSLKKFKVAMAPVFISLALMAFFGITLLVL